MPQSIDNRKKAKDRHAERDHQKEGLVDNIQKPGSETSFDVGMKPLPRCAPSMQATIKLSKQCIPSEATGSDQRLVGREYR